MDNVNKTTDLEELVQERPRFIGRAFGKSRLALFLLPVALALAILFLISPTLALMVVLGGLTVGLTLAYPYAGLLIMLAFIFLRPAERFPVLYTLHIVRVQSLLFLARWLLDRHLKQRAGLIHHGIMTAFLIGLVFMGFSSLTALWKIPAFQYFFDFLASFLVLIATVDLLNSEKRIRGYVATLLGVAAFLALEQIFTHSATPAGGEVMRAAGFGTFLQDNNDFGLAMLFFLPFAAYAALSCSSRLARAGAAALALLLVWSIIDTGSRGTAIGMIVLCLALWMKSNRKLLFGLGLMLFLALSWSLTPPSYKEHMHTIASYQQDQSAIVRMEAWKAGYGMFLRRPLFGVGPNNFSAAYYTPGYGTTSGGIWRAAHSIYIQTLAELGLAGIIWLLVVAVLMLLAARRTQRRLRDSERPDAARFTLATAKAVEVSLIAFLGAGAFLSCLYYPYLWIFGALAIAGEQTAQSRDEVVIAEAR